MIEARLEQRKVALLCAFGILICILWSNVGAYAQNTTSGGNSTTTPTATSQQQGVSKIKITSPTRGQQVPVGKDLTITGTSMDSP
ncbi:MAG TPA: hypothetical protein VJ729_10765, partial [Nitrososphaeraceae archaeon]|nr:hypothetical protein [Nitrososphaeraceae archaeon]